MSRIEHEHWECPNCCGRAVECLDCGYSGTREGFWRMEELHAHAIEDEFGPAARALETIATIPDDLQSRALVVERIARDALQSEHELERAIEVLAS